MNGLINVELKYKRITFLRMQSLLVCVYRDACPLIIECLWHTRSKIGDRRKIQNCSKTIRGPIEYKSKCHKLHETQYTRALSIRLYGLGHAECMVYGCPTGKQNHVNYMVEFSGILMGGRTFWPYRK